MNLRRLIPAIVLLGMPILHAAAVTGKVVDPSGRPVSGAEVIVEGSQKTTSRTDAQGKFHFAELPAGAYQLTAQGPGPQKSSMAPFVLRAKETKTVEVRLTEAPQAAFFDEPQFVVAGVSDGTSHGGHGSDTILRSTETLAKETASLGGMPPHESSQNAVETARAYQRAAELDPSERNLFEWGSELLIHRAPQQAKEVFTKGHRLYPDAVRMLLGLAVACYADGSYEEAARHFFEASDLDPSDPRPYLFLGKVQSSDITGTPGYTERLARFAKLQPDNAWANYYYAVNLWKQRASNDGEAAARVEELLEKAVRIDPTLAQGYLELGIVASDQGNFPRAIEAYRKSIAVNPDLAEAHYRLAQAYERTEEKAKAQAEFALHEQCSRKSQEQAERERNEIRQFVFAMRDRDSGSSQK